MIVLVAVFSAPRVALDGSISYMRRGGGGTIGRPEREEGAALAGVGVSEAKNVPTTFPQQHKVGVKMKRPARMLGEPGAHSRLRRV
jgi:hypothetical protein